MPFGLRCAIPLTVSRDVPVMTNRALWSTLLVSSHGIRLPPFGCPPSNCQPCARSTLLTMYPVCTRGLLLCCRHCCTPAPHRRFPDTLPGRSAYGRNNRARPRQLPVDDPMHLTISDQRPSAVPARGLSRWLRLEGKTARQSTGKTPKGGSDETEETTAKQTNVGTGPGRPQSHSGADQSLSSPD